MPAALATGASRAYRVALGRRRGLRSSPHLEDALVRRPQASQRLDCLQRAMRAARKYAFQFHGGPDGGRQAWIRAA
eukprot:20269-Alexandrium_andersonii.AAC.1